MGFIPPHGGYESLASYQMALIVFQGTTVFCGRFLRKADRTIDQMVQAARSGKQNIVEGCQVSGTSKEAEIKLIGVARASLEELLEDYRDFLRARKAAIWEKDSKEAMFVRALGKRKERSYKTYETYLETRPAEVVANIMVCLIHQTSFLLDQQKRALEAAFLKEGGLRERMTKARLAARSKNVSVAALAICFFIGTANAFAAEGAARANKESGGFVYPVGVANRRFVDQNGKVYLLKTMSSWAMAQNCTDAEITQALEGLKALKFNAVTVSPFGVHMNDSFADRYKNKAGQSFFTGKPHASALGPAWVSMDWVVREATRLEMTVVFSFFMSWKDTGTVPDLVAGGTTNAYEFGKAVASRYTSYSNIAWHVMGDYKWRYGEGPALALDAVFHGIRDVEGARHRLIIAEPANGSTSFDQFISAEGANGYQWFKQSADTIYHYGSSAVEAFDKVYQRAASASYPVVDIEPPYVNAPHYKGEQNQELRERNYATFIRGGAGINFGHEKWWPHGVTGLFDGGPGWLGVLKEAPQLDAKYCWSIVDEYVSDPTWRPDDGGFLKSGLGSGDDQAASGLSAGAALVYFPTSRAVVVDTTKIAKGGKVRLRWCDPTSGNYTVVAEEEAKSSERAVEYPAKGHADGYNDWVLVTEGI